MSDDQAITEAVAVILSERGAAGATVNELYQDLSGRGERVPIRDLRALLAALVARDLVRTGSRPSDGGRPAKIYLDPASDPQQRLFDMPFRTREEVGLDLIPPVERQRLKDEHGYLAEIGLDHLSRDRLVEAVRDAMPQLAQENPVELLLDFAEWTIGVLRGLRHEMLTAQSRQALQEAVQKFEFVSNAARNYFHDLFRLHRGLGNADRIFEIREVERVLAPKRSDDEVIFFDRNRATPILQRRVVGSSVVVMERDLDRIRTDGDEDGRMTVAASDASMIPLRVKVRPRGSYELPETLIIFTGAAAQVQPVAGALARLIDHDLDLDFLTTRDEVQAAEQGWMITEAIQGVIGEGHAKYAISAAQEFRQYRRDADILLNRIAWKGVSGLQPKRADVLVRDGRLYPLVHRIRDYEAGGLYGRIVRNEVQEFAEVCRRALDEYDYFVYGAFVKQPVQYFLAPLVFWYCRERMGFTDRVPATSIFRPPLGDSLLAYVMLRQYLEGRPPEPNGFVSTFRVLRRYSDLVLTEELPRLRTDDSGVRLLEESRDEDWVAYFKERRAERQRRYDERIEETPPISEREYLPLRFLCQRVGVLMSFAMPADGRFRGGLPSRLPRCEVLVDLARPFDEMGAQYRRLLAAFREPDMLIVDDDHPDDSSIPLIIPLACREAHRAAVFADDLYRREVERRLVEAVGAIERAIRLRTPVAV